MARQEWATVLCATLVSLVFACSSNEGYPVFGPGASFGDAGIDVVPDSAGSDSCLVGAACVDNSDCPDGARCNDALSPPACATLYCAPRGTACREDLFCGAELVCDGTTCVDCVGDGDCAADEFCQDASCVPLADGATCATSRDCSDAAVCDGRVCRDAPPLRSPEAWDAASVAGDAGRPCESDRDCTGGSATCLTDQMLEDLGAAGSVPGGMCTKLFCQDDAACGEVAACIDASFLGAPVSMCARRCDADSDCRRGSDYVCAGADGLEAGASGYCVPHALID